jgi:hypothetical protein
VIIASIDPTVLAAIIAALVALVTTVLATPLRLWADTILEARRLRIADEFEQRRELRKLIGRYHGRLIAAAESWSDRLGNLYYMGEREGWLNEPKGYYFVTTCHRFLSVCGLTRAFEREAYFIDSRSAEPGDLDFLNFMRAFRWVMTDPALFRDVGLEYEETVSQDHFFADQLRRICDAFCPAERDCLSYQEFEGAAEEPGHPFEAVFEFFVGLDFEEDRFRWDRIVCFHLLVKAFLNTVGYKTQVSSNEEFRAVASKIKHSEIVPNLRKWIPLLGLGEQPEARRMLWAVEVEVGSRPRPSAGPPS